VVRSKAREFTIQMDRQAQLAITGVGRLETPDGWTPEYLLLATLSRWSVASLTFHAARANLAVAAEVTAHGTVTRRESDGRHAFTDLRVSVAVEIDPVPSPDDLAALLAKAERDCFVGASLVTAPQYAWAVNGIEASHTA
jgi:organic hydroperoxide reductase OsmC/OhrA